MTGWWRDWTGAVVVAGVAVAVWFLGAAAFPAFDGWIDLGLGLGLALALVASNGFRTRRDPALLFLAAGGASFALCWLASAAASARDAATWLSALGRATLFLGPLALAASMVLVVPWRDRRGRRPLRVGTVVLGFALPLLAAGTLVATSQLSVTVTQIRVLATLTGALATVAAARAIVRGGWHGWVGGASFALLLSSAATWIVLADARAAVAEGAFAWLTLLPSVSLVGALVGALSAQHAEASRMRRATDRATEVMEGRAEIASVVAHDVRGPAGTIRSIAGSLRTSYGRLDDDQRLEFVGMVEQESMRLLRVADQMSLGLKTDAGTLPITLVEREVEGAVLQGLHDADARPRVVLTDLDPDVRAPIDARWIAEAVRQGLDNALRYSPVDAPIELRLRAEGSDAVIEIEDRGPGIPPELRDQVFEKFCRWRPAGYEDVSGSGLGLFITRQIARAHGGDATLVTGAAGGTILRMRLPTEPAT